MTSEVGCGSVLVRCTISDWPGGTTSAGPGTLTVPAQLGGAVLPLPHSAYPHIGTPASVVVPVCSQYSTACAGAAPRAPTMQQRSAAADQPGWIRMHDAAYSVIATPGASIIRKVFIPPGNTLLVVISFSLCECQIWK